MSEYESEQLCDELEAENKQLKDENERLKENNEDKRRQYAKEAHDEVAEGEIKALKQNLERQAAVVEAAKSHDHIYCIGDDKACCICEALARLEGGEDE